MKDMTFDEWMAQPVDHDFIGNPIARKTAVQSAVSPELALGWMRLAYQAGQQSMAPKLDALLNHCPEGDCAECSKIICQHECGMHFHHDGCPACAERGDLT